MVGSEVEINLSEEVRSPDAIVIGSVVQIFFVFKRLFRHLLNWNGLRMFQSSGMINLETKFEGSSNRPCAKHYEDQRESRRVCEWQSKLLTWKFPRKHVPMTKKIVKVGHYFFRIRVFFWDVSAGTPISVFSLWSFRFVVLLCKRDFSGGKNEVWSVSKSRRRARDHNLAGVVLITWRSFSLKTHDDFYFEECFSN